MVMADPSASVAVPQAPPFDFRAVVSTVAARHGLSFRDLMRRSRRRPVVRARWEVFAALRARGMSLPRIARFWGLDHTTVLYGLRAHNALVVSGGVQ